MLKIYNYITKTALIIAIFTIPAIAFAGTSGDFGSDSWDSGSGWSDWGGSTPTYSYEYTPNYTYTTPSYGSYNTGYTPYYTPSYTTPSYGSGYSYSYTPNYYTPTYTTPSYGSVYTGSSYGGSSIPSSTVSNSSATASNTNINNNNVYVYTTPTNGSYYNNSFYNQNLSGYCDITPSNPRVGQTVTANAYATGGNGGYTYTWGGDLNSYSYNSNGSNVSFTSYSAGTRNITVTIRSNSETITRSCSVVFQNNNNSYYGSTADYQSSVAITRSISPSGSGIYLNDLPATGLSLNFTTYMIAIMILILALVSTFVFQAKKRLIKENA